MFQRKIRHGDGDEENRERQDEIWSRSELAEAPGRPFHRKLEEAGFDKFISGTTPTSQAGRRWFPACTIGFLEGINSERGIAWGVADSLSLRSFPGYGIDVNTPVT